MSTDKYQIRLFLGTLKNSEIQMYLRQSKQWQEMLLLGTRVLSETYFQDQEYIGMWHPISLVTYDELRRLEKNTQAQLLILCPDLNVEKLSLILFPQVFVN